MGQHAQVDPVYFSRTSPPAVMHTTVFVVSSPMPPPLAHPTAIARLNPKADVSNVGDNAGYSCVAGQPGHASSASSETPKPKAPAPRLKRPAPYLASQAFPQRPTPAEQGSLLEEAHRALDEASARVAQATSENLTRISIFCGGCDNHSRTTSSRTSCYWASWAFGSINV